MAMQSCTPWFGKIWRVNRWWNMYGAGEWKVLVDEYAVPQHPAAHYLKLTQNTRPTHAPTHANHILVQNSTPVHLTLVQMRCHALWAWGGVLMLSGKDKFGQGKEIVRIVLYKCYVLVERSAWCELDGYDSNALHVVLEACTSDTLWELMVHWRMDGTGLRRCGRYLRGGSVCSALQD